MTREQLYNYLEHEEIECSDIQLDLLFTLMDSTLKQNEKFNLTAITDKGQFVEKMIYDSAVMLHDLDLSRKSIIDIGTGAGFPGMVVRILAPKAEVTLLDSTKKKIDYLLDFAKQNNLEVTGISKRAEDYARNNREQYDYAVARAVASLNILLEIIMPLVKVGGTFIAMKGPEYVEEVNACKNAFKKLHCHIEHVYEIELPESKQKRAIVYIQKDEVTNKKYPRQYNEIKKQPL